MRWMSCLVIAAALGTGSTPAQTVPSPTIKVAYPPQALSVPKLRAYLMAQEATLRAKLIAAAANDARQVRAAGYKPNRFEADHRWTLVTRTPRFLSLLVDRYDYTGGAHGMDSFSSILWDRNGEAVRTPLSLFASPAALSAAIRPDYCRRLDAMRRQRRGGALNPADTEFNACLDPVAEVVFLGSATRSRFDRHRREAR